MAASVHELKDGKAVFEMDTHCALVVEMPGSQTAV